jgi:membrane-associated phospholipid phosphatase
MRARSAILALFVLALCSTVTIAQEEYPRNGRPAPNAVDALVPPLPTAAERRLADLASTIGDAVVIVLDAKASWDSPDRGRAFLMQGGRVAATYGAVFLVKTLFHRERPCHALFSFHGYNESGVCGADQPFFSLPSGHTAVAFQARGGPRLAFVLPISVGVGGLRIAAGKHWLTDVLAGGGIGLATSFIR